MDTVEFEVPETVVTAGVLNGTAVTARAPSAAPVAQSETAQVMSMIERFTLDTTVPIERAEQAFTFWQRVRADQAKASFIAAMTDCQAEMEPVRKDCDNRQTSSRYASFSALDRAIRPIYTKHGFSVSHDTASSELPDHVRVLMTITHRDGHERVHTADMPCDGKGAKGGDVMTKTHAMGSAMSYGKRYNLGNGFNIATDDDDDGNAAGRKATDAAPKFITAEQIGELEVLIKETGADLAKFLAYGKVSSLAEIPAAHFGGAKRLLMQRKAAGGAK